MSEVLRRKYNIPSRVRITNHNYVINISIFSRNRVRFLTPSLKNNDSMLYNPNKLFLLYISFKSYSN